MFEIHNSKILDAYDKNCWFCEHAKLSYFTSKNDQETGTEFIALWRQFVCSGLFTPCHWGEIQRLKNCQVILNRIVSPICQEFLEENREDVEESLTNKLRSLFEVTWRFDLAIQMSFLCHVMLCHVLTLRPRKINNFYRRKLKDWNCVFIHFQEELFQKPNIRFISLSQLTSRETNHSNWVNTTWKITKWWCSMNMNKLKPNNIAIEGVWFLSVMK